MILIDFQQVFVLHGSSTLVLNAHELNRAEVSPMGWPNVDPMWAPICDVG